MPITRSRAAGDRGERADRNRARVRGKDRFRREQRVGFAEDVLLDGGVLDNRLDHQVCRHQAVDHLDPCEHRPGIRAPLLGELRKASLHRSERAIGRTGIRVGEDDLATGRRNHLGDPAAHLPGADDEHPLDHRSRHPRRRSRSRS
jgi:hypothetical protein